MSSETMTFTPPANVRELKQEIQRRIPVQYCSLPTDPLFQHESELAYRYDILRLATLVSGGSLRERCKAWVKRWLSLPWRWLLMRQVEYNEVMLDHQRETGRLLAVIDRNMSEMFASLTTLQRRLDALSGQRQQENAQLQQLHEQCTSLHDVLFLCRRRLDQLEKASPDGGPAEPKPAVQIDYVMFTNQYRGSRELIRRRQQVYLPYFLEQGPVLDIGCGRGEFLEMLTEARIPVVGIDCNPEMIAYCQEKGFPAVRAEALEYLNQITDSSLGGIFLAQVVEHMPAEDVFHLMGRCWSKLRPGGVLVIETVNPTCPAAYGNFHLDPTHIRPVHPELLRFFYRNHGFTVVEFVLSSPVVPDREPVVKIADIIQFDATVYPDYAIVGRK
ncbi:MAG: class I SAM-dependent methyltransferase [Gemmataceae bacterium]